MLDIKGMNRFSLLGLLVGLVLVSILVTGTLNSWPESHGRSRRSVEKDCMCGPGKRVKTPCTTTQPAVCEPCAPGTFNNGFTNFTSCSGCTYVHCPSRATLVSECTLTADIVCQCQHGFESITAEGDKFACFPSSVQATMATTKAGISQDQTYYIIKVTSAIPNSTNSVHHYIIGIIRHYVTILLSSEKKSDLQQVADSHALMRSRILRENGKYIPKDSYLIRKSFFNHEEKGFFNTEKREAQVKNPMTDPSMMTDMMKGNITNVLPMIVIGGWINWAFSGFLTTKVPFPLTLRFKPMLQRGVELQSLDASWVSSASWYFLNVFGLRSMYTLILGQDNAADQTRMMQEQMSGSAMMAPQDPMKAFKAEWEALEISNHDWILDGVEEELTGGIVQPETIYIKNKFT